MVSYKVFTGDIRCLKRLYCVLVKQVFALNCSGGGLRRQTKTSVSFMWWTSHLFGNRSKWCRHSRWCSSMFYSLNRRSNTWQILAFEHRIQAPVFLLSCFFHGLVCIVWCQAMTASGAADEHLMCDRPYYNKDQWSRTPFGLAEVMRTPCTGEGVGVGVTGPHLWKRKSGQQWKQVPFCRFWGFRNCEWVMAGHCMPELRGSPKCLHGDQGFCRPTFESHWVARPCKTQKMVERESLKVSSVGFLNRKDILSKLI